MGMDAHIDALPVAARKTDCQSVLQRDGPSTRSRLPSVQRIDLLMLWAVDLGLVASIFAVPLILGGRIAWGQLVLVGLALWVAICWCLRQCLHDNAGTRWFRSPAEPILLAAVVLIGLQQVPLPPSVVSVLSPRLYDALPLWAPQDGSSATLGVWNTLSLTPAATRNALVLFLAFVLLFITTTQRVRRVEDVERMLRWVAVSTLVLAAFGLLQYLTSNGKFFWFFEHPHYDTKTSVSGSFTNRNHFANFIALGIGPLIWWVWEGLQNSSQRKRSPHERSAPRRARTDVTASRNVTASRSVTARMDVNVGLRVLALAFCVFVGLMSTSRGGAMAMGTAAVVCVLVLYRGGLLRRKMLLVIGVVGLILAAGLGVYGYQSVADRLDDFASLDELDGGQIRRSLWLADIKATADYPLVGTGLGSHSEVCPMYHPTASSLSIEYTHAENGYVQIALETGVPGLLLALAAVGLCAYWCLSTLRRGVSRRVLLCVAAIAAGLAASFVHSLSDFVWYVPGCMVTVVILAACAGCLWQETRLSQGRTAPHWQISRGGWLAATACLILIGYFMLQNRLATVRAEPYWFRCLSLDKALPKLHGADRQHALSTMAEQLARVVKWQPDHPRAHAQLADVHVKLFDYSEDAEVTPLDVRQVRDTVLASNFPSTDAMRTWLWRAFGRRCEHLDAAWRSAKKAVNVCPLQGEAYLLLAELSFLDESDRTNMAAWTGQAMKVRPFDGAVSFVAGQEAALAGDTERALACWNVSFRSGWIHRGRLLRALAPQWPASFMIQTFRPDVSALKQIERAYRSANRPQEARVALEHYARASADDARRLQAARAAQSWVAAAGAYKQLGDSPRHADCLRNAVGCDSSRFQTRHELGICLYKLRELEEAETHLRWCLQRRPRDRQLRTQLEAVLDGKLRAASRPAQGRGGKEGPT